MICDMQKTNYVLKGKNYPLYVCKRKACRGHGFDRGKGIPKRICDHPRVSFYIGTILQIILLPIAFVFFVFGMACKCKQRRDYLNRRFGFFVPAFRQKEFPWDDPDYRERLTIKKGCPRCEV